MRVSGFGNYIVEDTKDDLADAFYNAETDANECYASISDGADGGFVVEIMNNEDGEVVASTDDGLFTDLEAAKTWARSWVSDVQTNVA